MEASRAGTGAKSRKRLTWKYHWTEEEDELLRKLVKRHGPGNWKYIANHIEGRTGMSCRLRWVNHLNPKVDKTPFSEEEQEKLLQLHRDFGNKWSAIVSYFPGRTDNQVKNQFHAMMSRRMKHSIPSSGTDGRGCLNMGPAVLSGSDVLMGGSRCIGCAGCLTLIREKTNMPLTSSGSSSIYGRDETWSAAPFSYRSRNGDHSFGRIYLGNMYANLGTSHGNSDNRCFSCDLRTLSRGLASARSKCQKLSIHRLSGSWQCRVERGSYTVSWLCFFSFFIWDFNCLLPFIEG